MDHRAEPGDLARVAAQWVARRDAGLAPNERRELQEWLAAGQGNAAAFAAADTSATELDLPLHLGAVDEVMAGLARRARKRRRRRVIATTAAAAVMMLVGAVLLQTRIPASPTSPRSSRLVVKTPERELLPDGSVVELKDGARIATQFSDAVRSVTLLRGTAHFQVEKQARPFVVSAGGVTADALGTAFSVALEGANVSVLVTSGRVAVNTESDSSPAGSSAPIRTEPLAILEAGKAVSVAVTAAAIPQASAIEDVPQKEVEDRLAWRIPRLEFSGTPLIDVVAMVNRHNVQQLEIADRSIESLALSGIVRADKVDALLDLLQSEFGVKCERKDARIILRPAR